MGTRMKMIIKAFSLVLASIGIFLLSSHKLSAQTYPDKAITIVVAYTP